MDRLEVALQIRPPIGWTDDVVQFQAIFIPKDQPTAGAAPALASEQTRHWRVCRPTRAQACAPIPEIPVVWRGCIPYFDVPLVVHRRVLDDSEALGGSKTPALSAAFVPVALNNPAGGFGGMASSAPATEHRVQGVVAVVERLNAQDMTVVRAPPTNLGVQGGDEGCLGCTPHPSHRCVQIRDVTLDGLLAWRDAHLEPRRYLPFEPAGPCAAGAVLANRKAQEVQAHGPLIPDCMI